jgi:hypothetical protein
MGLDNRPLRTQHRLQQERSNAGAINKPGLHGAIRMFAASSDGVLGGWAGSGPKGWHSRSAGAGLVPGSGLPKRPEPSLPASNPRLPSTPLPSTPLHSTPQLLPSFSRRVDVMTTCCTGAPSAHFSISISTSQNRILISMKLTHVMLEVHAANSSSFSSSPGRQFGPVDRFQRVGDRVSDSPSCALSYRLPVSLTKSAGDGRMRGFTVRMGTGAASCQNHGAYLAYWR